MVHTFLVDFSYAQSAALLDREHLGKQRVEAYQILLTIEDLYLVAQYFNTSVPVNPNEWKPWIRLLAKQYLSLPFRFARDLDTGQVYTCTQVESNTSQYHHVKLAFPVYHPAVLMWLGHPESLKEYINAHIQEWIRRGYKNNMKQYEVKNPVRPLWTVDSKIIENHRAALLKKELDRGKPAWFQLRPEFVSLPAFTGYIWPY